MSRSQLALTALVTILLATPAAATVTVVGGSMASACYREAVHRRTDPDSVRICSVALTDEGLSRRDRAATFINRGVVYMNRRD